MTEDDQWLIWSNLHRKWWRPNSCGYTTLTHQAGRYSTDRALVILQAANIGCAPSRPNEVMVRAPTLQDCVADISDYVERFIDEHRSSK